MRITDIELTRYRSFLAHMLSADKREDECWREFREILKTSAGYLRTDEDPQSEKASEIPGLENTVERELKRKDSQKRKINRILKSGTETSSYIGIGDIERRLYAASYLDVYLLNESVYKNCGQSLAKVAEELKDELPQYSKCGTCLPVDSFSFFVETRAVETNKSKIFEELLDRQYVELDLEFAYLAVRLDHHEVSTVIVPKGNKKSKNHALASYLFNELMQEYFLSVAKIANERNLIKEIDPEVSRDDLLQLIAWLNERPLQTIAQIEYANRTLSTYRAVLGENITEIKRHEHTIDLNIGNAAGLTDYAIWSNHKEELTEKLIAPLRHESDQIKANLRYLELFAKLAEIKLAEIGNLSNLQAGIYGRKLAMYFGFLALIGVFQLFKQFMDWDDTGGKILILGAVIVLPFWALFARDIKDYFFGIEKFNPPSQTGG